MKTKSSILLSVTLTLAFALFAPSAMAEPRSLTESFEKVQQQAEELGLSTETEPESLVREVIKRFLQIIGIIALVLVIYGGFVYMTAAGDPGRAEKGKKIVLGTIIGLIIIGLAAVIVSFIIGLFATRGTGSP